MSIVPINDAERSNDSNFCSDLWDSSAMVLNLDMWNPFNDFPSISNFFPDMGFGSTMNTRVDWRETRRAHVWKVVVPGFSNEDVLVELQDERVLQVSVESGNFMSRFKIPDDGNLELLKATMMHDGVLVVTVPKYEQDRSSRGNVRVVEIEGSD